MSWLSDFWAKFSGNVRDEKGLYAIAIPTWQEGKPVYSGVNFENMVRQGFRKNELIFSCISKTANTASQVNLRVYSEDADDPLDDHPLHKLLQRPNPYMSEYDFWVSVIIYIRLAGKAAYEIEFSNKGDPIHLWPLRPDWLKTIPSSQNFISGYSYEVPGLDPALLDPHQVVVFNDWDPLNQYQGYPRSAVASRVGDIDNSTTDFIQLFFQHGAAPSGLLTTVQKLNDAQVSEIRRRWRERYGGMNQWTDPAVLDKDAKYQQMGLTFTEMGFDTLDARNEGRICMVMDVPPILVGAKIGLDRSTYSNYKEARIAWWQDSLLPLYASFLDVVENQLMPHFPDPVGAYPDWDVSRVPALQEERNARWDRAVKALASGGITLNEFRQELGLPDMGSGGEIFIRTLAQVEVPAKRKAALPAGTTATEPEAEPDMAETDMGEMDAGKRLLPHTHGKGVVAANAPDDNERRKLEASLSKDLLKYFKGQQKRIEASLKD